MGGGKSLKRIAATNIIFFIPTLNGSMVESDSEIDDGLYKEQVFAVA